MEQSIPVSVVVITKNEERNIGKALQSVRDFAELIVIDDFSDDGTPSIARRFTDKFFQMPWQGYAKQKQSGIEKATGPWVLVLDADESVTEELKQEILAAIADPVIKGYYIPRKNFFLGRWIKGGGWWPDYTLRLFRKEAAYMEVREVHEKIVVDGETGQLKNPMEHYTYGTITDYIKKMDNYSTLSAKEMHKKGRPFRLHSLLARPPFTFVRMFFLRKGFRDGFHGFVLALLYSFYTFLKYLKLWEINRN